MGVGRQPSEVNFPGNCAGGTIDFWIYSDQNTGTVAVLDKRQKLTAPMGLIGYEVYLWQGKLGFQMASGSGNFSCNSPGSTCNNYTSPFVVANNQWHFVAITFQRCPAPAGMFYVDGNTAPFNPRVGNLDNTSPLYIGREVPNMAGTFFRGLLDELEISQRPTSKAQLDAIYKAGPFGKCRKF